MTQKESKVKKRVKDCNPTFKNQGQGINMLWSPPEDRLDDVTSKRRMGGQVGLCA